MPGRFDLSLGEYYSKLEPLEVDCFLTEFRSLRARLAWMSHTRLDIICSVALASQVTGKTLSNAAVKNINKIVAHLKKSTSFVRRYGTLDNNSLTISAYADASFANNEDLLSQIGMVIYLSHKTRRCNILRYGSYKDRIVTKTIIAGALYSWRSAAPIG